MEHKTCHVLSLTVHLQTVYVFTYLLAGLVIFSLLGFDSVIVPFLGFTGLGLSPGYVCITQYEAATV